MWVQASAPPCWHPGQNDVKNHDKTGNRTQPGDGITLKVGSHSSSHTSQVGVLKRQIAKNNLICSFHSGFMKKYGKWYARTSSQARKGGYMWGSKGQGTTSSLKEQWELSRQTGKGNEGVPGWGGKGMTHHWRHSRNAVLFRESHSSNHPGIPLSEK